MELPKKSNISKKHCPLIPMGAVTGRPTKNELREFLGEYLRVGIDQFMIYPRSGLEVEYLSEEWFEICRHIIEFAAENGMAIWLYDEYNWPSGKAGGKVIRENPDFALKKISVFGKSYCDDSSMPENINNQYYWSVPSIPLYADLLNPAAVDCFMDLTHKKYASLFGEYFGTTIKGIFTDEPSVMYSAKFHPTKGALLELPYYSEIESEYFSKTGHNFREDVELHLNNKTPEYLWKSYFQLIGKRFCQCFFEKINSWCTSHKLFFTGHLMDEYFPVNSIWASGDAMCNMSAFSMPGIDEIFTSTKPENIEWLTIKMLESVTSLNARHGLAELFALGPCDMTLAKMRQMIWLMALHGVDHYVTAVSAIDARGNIEKPAYYNPFSPTQPWFEAFKELGDEARIASEFAGKKAKYKIAVRYPQSLAIDSEIFKIILSSPCSIVDLLRELAMKQWPVRLLEETSDEISDYDVLLCLESNCIREEKSGTIFNSLSECLDWIESNLNRDTEVRNHDGILQENLLVKTFGDSTIVALSLMEEDCKNLTLRRDGCDDIIFDLPSRGVFVSRRDDENGPPDEKILVLPDEGMSCKILSPNTMRILFNDEKSFKFTLSEDMDKLQIINRNYGGAVSIMLNGNAIVADQPCESLPHGLRNLYSTSELFSLSQGYHEIKLVLDTKDYPYLPLAFLSGQFGLLPNHELVPLASAMNIGRFRQQGLTEYAGKITFTRQVSLKNCSSVELAGNDLAVELFVDGNSLGRRAWMPFRWTIPAEYRRDNVKLQLLVSTSIGPLFSNYSENNNEYGECLEIYWPDNRVVPGDV